MASPTALPTGVAVPTGAAAPGGAVDFEPGSLVRARGREWVVLPGGDAELLVARPLGGDEEFVAGLFRGEASSVGFPRPRAVPEAIGNHRSAALLATALRLGFTAGAGPLRSLAGVTVTPRQYQLVPLLLAMRQQTVRLLIGDDVGIGKTVEAGLIAKELLVQGDARGLAVLCPPALAEQWRSELAEKLAVEAELVLSSTAPRLQRRTVGGESIFDRFPFTVVSTDFVKTEARRELFARTCPDLVIVDEAHTCVAASAGTRDGGRGPGSSTAGQRQRRYELLRRIADEPMPDGRRRHLILVTATPHSGNEEAFRDLLGLLSPELAEIDLDQRRGRETLARYFVQRRRRDIRRYLDQETPFPADRLTRDVGYELGPEFADLHQKALAFARQTVTGADGERTRRVRWWSALALLRSVASSPRAAAATFEARTVTASAETAGEADALGRPGGFDLIEEEALDGVDAVPGASDETLPAAGRTRLRAMAAQARALEGTRTDRKLAMLITEVKRLQLDGYDPIVFCRYIPTAEYVGEHLAAALGKKAVVATVTGKLPHPERAARIAELTGAGADSGEGAGGGPDGGAGGRRRCVLVATDCLSEGVNLQEHFQAVIHYDLAWNPTRHEQREGRVDRFGQRRDRVRAVTMYGTDNGIDGLVLDVLLRKHRRIARDTGVAVPVPDSSEQVLVAMLEGLVLHNANPNQLTLDFGVTQARDDLHDEWHSAAERESRAITKYAHSAVDLDQVRDVLDGVRTALGTQADVRRFVHDTLADLGAMVTNARDGFTVRLTGLPPGVRDALGVPDEAAELAFHDDLPVPPGHRALVRTDPAVVGLARHVLETALDDGTGSASGDGAGEIGSAGVAGAPAGRPGARCGVFRTSAVSTRTVLVLARYRFHLTLPGAAQRRATVAEDARLLAYRRDPDGHRQWLDAAEVARLLAAEPENALPELVLRQAERAVAELDDVQPELDARGAELAVQLREAHLRIREVAGARKGGLTVTPHERADVLGVYVYLPTGVGP
jgi:superfamily II DNA or RNA helicase